MLNECRVISDGAVADYIPELAKADPMHEHPTIRTDRYRNLARTLTAHLGSANAQLRALD